MTQKAGSSEGKHASRKTQLQVVNQEE